MRRGIDAIPPDIGDTSVVGQADLGNSESFIRSRKRGIGWVVSAHHGDSPA
jgi:hypothetical protein